MDSGTTLAWHRDSLKPDRKRGRNEVCVQTRFWQLLPVTSREAEFANLLQLGNAWVGRGKTQTTKSDSLGRLPLGGFCPDRRFPGGIRYDPRIESHAKEIYLGSKHQLSFLQLLIPLQREHLSCVRKPSSRVEIVQRVSHSGLEPSARKTVRNGSPV